MKHRGLIARCVTIAAVGIVSAGLLSAPAFAQQGGGGQGGQGGGRRGGQRGGMRLTVADIPVDVLGPALKLTDDQKARIAEARKPYAELVEANSKAMAAARASGQAPDRQAMMETMQKQQAAKTDADTAINGILTDSQKEDVRPLIQKLAALNGIVPVGVYGKLGLTAEQETKLTDAVTKSQEKQRAAMEALRANGQPSQQDMMDVMNKTRADLKVSRDTILTPEQSKMVDEYVKDHPQAMMGGYGGGGRQRGGGAPGGGGGNL